MGEKVRAAVLGATGGIGKTRVKAIGQDERAELKIVCVRSEEAGRAAAEEAGATYVSDAEEAVGAPDVDAVLICTPNTTHTQLAKAALLAGKHVCVEYPGSQSLDEFDELCQLASERNLVFNVALTVRQEGPYLAMKRGVDRIGEPKMARLSYFGGKSWYVVPELRGDQFVALHIHFLDQFQGLLGPVTWVDAGEFDVTDEVACCGGPIVMGHESGALSVIEFAMGFSSKPAYEGHIVGTKGYIRFRKQVTLITPDGEESLDLEGPAKIGDAISDDTTAFIDQILGVGGARSDQAMVRSALQLALAASQAAKEGRRVTLAPATRC